MLWAGTKSHKAGEERFRWWEESKRSICIHSMWEVPSGKAIPSLATYLKQANGIGIHENLSKGKQATAGHFGSTEVLQNLLDVLQLGVLCVRGDFFLVVCFFFFFALLSKGCLETDKFPNAMTHLKPLGLSWVRGKKKMSLTKTWESSWEKWRQSWGLVVISIFPTKMKHSQLLVTIKKKVLMLAYVFQHSSSDKSLSY